MEFLYKNSNENDEFTIYDEKYTTLHGSIRDGCLHLCSNVYGEEFDSEKNYDFTKDDTDKLFSIMPLKEFIKNCQKGHIPWMEDFLEENNIHPKTFTW